LHYPSPSSRKENRIIDNVSITDRFLMKKIEAVDELFFE